MSDILCTSPGCQTTAGCQCSRVGRITQLTYGKRTPVGAGDGNTFIVDVAHYERVIRDLQRENQALRTELAEAKIAIGWARDAGIEGERASIRSEAEAQSKGKVSVEAWQQKQAGQVLLWLDDRDVRLAAAFPFQAEEAKER